MNKTMFCKPIFRKTMMRAAMLALCTALLGTVPMLAQDNTAPPPPTPDQAGPPMGGHGGRGMRGNNVEMLTKRLNLTPDQAAQVKAIDEDTMKQAMAVRDDTSIAKPDKRGKMMEIHKAAQDKIRAVLNDDQKTKYDAMQAQMRERRMNHEGGSGAPPPPPPGPPQ